MPTFHHANIGVTPEQEPAEISFLVDILGYTRLEPSEAAKGFGARWFEANDGTQIHLSVHETHLPHDRAHNAIDVTGEDDVIQKKLDAAGIEYASGEFNGVRVTNCKDPAGNGWELRSAI